MGRADENDLTDIRFLHGQEPVSEAHLRAAFSRARVPGLPEIQERFRAAQPKVLALARSICGASPQGT